MAKMVALFLGVAFVAGASPGYADSPLTPIIGLSPSAIDFGCVSVGDSLEVLAELFNNTADPSSILEVTDISVTGAGYLLVDGPGLPMSIPGDSTVVELTIRFQPASAGQAIGTLAITATSAANSPLNVPLTGDTCAEERWQTVTGEY